MIETQPFQQDRTNTFFISQALNEVLGYQPIDDVQVYSSGFDSRDFQQVWEDIHNRFGCHGCSGMAYRVGQAMFKYGLQEFGPTMGAAGIEFRLSPTRKKLWLSLLATGEIIQTYLHKVVRVLDQDDHFRLEISGFGEIEDSAVQNAIVHMLRGMVQSALDWASGGKYYVVTPQKCDTSEICTLKIDNSPI